MSGAGWAIIMAILYVVLVPTIAIRAGRTRSSPFPPARRGPRRPLAAPAAGRAKTAEARRLFNLHTRITRPAGFHES